MFIQPCCTHPESISWKTQIFMPSNFNTPPCTQLAPKRQTTITHELRSPVTFAIYDTILKPCDLVWTAWILNLHIKKHQMFFYQWRHIQSVLLFISATLYLKSIYLCQPLQVLRQLHVVKGKENWGKDPFTRIPCLNMHCHQVEKWICALDLGT